MIKYLLFLVMAVGLHGAPDIDPDVEIRINGLVCSICGLGVKNVFEKNIYVKKLKIDSKKQILLLEYNNAEIHPNQIQKMVKKAGYEVASIKWLKKKKPNRYNKP